MTEFNDTNDKDAKPKKFKQTYMEFRDGKVVNLRPYPEEIKFMTYPEIKALPAHVADFMIYPILPTDGILLLYAPPGLGKTTFTLCLAKALATGGDFLKFSAPKPRRVMYIDAEMKLYQVKDRLQNAKIYVGEENYLDNLLILCKTEIYPVELPELQSPEGAKFYVDFLKKNKIDVVVFDNLSTLSSFNENFAQEWNPIQNLLLSLRSSGISTIVIHHSNKEGTGFRGTSKISAIMDTVIALKEVHKDRMDDEYLKEKIYKVEFEKSREFGGIDARPFEVTLDERGFTYRSIEITLIDKVVQMLNIPMKQKEIAIELKLSSGYVSKLVAKARELRLLPFKI